MRLRNLLTSIKEKLKHKKKICPSNATVRGVSSEEEKAG